MSPRESEQVLEIFWEHAARPEFTFRYKWEQNDLVMWDNRSDVYCVPRDIYETDFDRQLYRVTLMGDVPVGVDGRDGVDLRTTDHAGSGSGCGISDGRNERTASIRLFPTHQYRGRFRASKRRRSRDLDQNIGNTLDTPNKRGCQTRLLGLIPAP